MAKFDYENKNKIKYFKPLDIVFYLVILIIITVLLCVFLIPKNENTLEKVEIYKGNNLIYCYDYESKMGNTNSLANKLLIEEYDKNNIHYVKIIENENFNIVEIGNDYAKMGDANCSHLKLCVNNFSPIKKGGDVIICMPHEIRLVGIGKNANDNEIRL